MDQETRWLTRYNEVKTFLRPISLDPPKMRQRSVTLGTGLGIHRNSMVLVN